jgi:GGDEF domain-containing protein
MDALNETLTVDGNSMTVGASIGISEFPHDSGNAEELLLNADAAMYAAKSGGRCAYLRYRDLLAMRLEERAEEARERAQAHAARDAIEGREAEPTA